MGDARARNPKKSDVDKSLIDASLLQRLVGSPAGKGSKNGGVEPGYKNGLLENYSRPPCIAEISTATGFGVWGLGFRVWGL